MKLRITSLLARIVILHVIVVLATSLALVGAIYLLLNSILSAYEFRTLGQHEIAVASALASTPKGLVLNLPKPLDVRYAQRYGGFTFVILDQDGRVLFASVPGLRALVDSRGARDPVFVQSRSSDGLYAAASFVEHRGATPVTIQVAQDLGDPDAIADDVVAMFLHKMLWLLVGVLAMLIVADIVIVRRALRPVVEASLQAQSIDPIRISVRLPTRDLPSEVSPLVHAVNLAFDRLEDGFRAQREFAANAAHELRTPLSVLRMRIETLCDPATARALALDIDVMARIVGQLLAMAELETVVVTPDQRVDLNEVCQSVAAYLAPLAVSKAKALTFAGPDAPVWVRGDSELLFQAVRNLVENAITHTQPGTSVEIEVKAGGGVVVRDHGPGIPPDERELVFRRFWRGDRQSSGAGLGLSIVMQIVDAHGGAVSIATGRGDGSEFEIRLNAAEAQT